MTPPTVRGRALLGASLVDAAIVVDDGRIVEIRREPGSGETGIIPPGFIDLQVNGGFGCEVGPDPDALHTLARRLPATGVTSFLPTFITAPDDEYAQVFRAFDVASGAAWARPLGLHLEGPFLSTLRPGAHRVDVIEAADPSLLDSLLDEDALMVMTLAPERAGAIEMIHRLCARGVIVSLGHTDATRQDYQRGIDAGATMGTHLFNAMSPFGHREPNAIGAALVDDRITVGLIADGIHCHPAALEIAVRCKGPERLALVTDMMSAAGMPDGRYELGGTPALLRDGAVRLTDGTLAGSVLLLDQAVRNMVRWTSLSAVDALRTVTETPARVLNRPDLGRIVEGARADLVVLTPTLEVVRTMVGGDWVYGADTP